jgi:hypothetical protein
MLLCRRHHRAVHEEGYGIDRQPDGDVRFRRPDGRLLPEVPHCISPPANAADDLTRQNRERGLRIDPRTACPTWLGERLDLNWSIDVLRPPAPRSGVIPLDAPRVSEETPGQRPFTGERAPDDNDHAT